jgi:hypothetical protein
VTGVGRFVCMFWVTWVCCVVLVISMYFPLGMLSFFLFLWYWGLNFDPCAWKAGALPFESCS